MTLTADQRDELLTFNNGKPLIVTKRESPGGDELFSVLAFVRSVSSPTPEYTEAVSLSLSFPEAFPAAPPAVRLSQGLLFHPNFTGDGRWSGSALENNETLSEYLMRLVRCLQYKEIYADMVANRNAMAWYNKHRDAGIFPTDPINYWVKPRISIHRVNENARVEPAHSIRIGAIHYDE